jgi:hypothetical protein
MARQKKPADAVQFTFESAERIANVVRAAETTPPSASPLTFGRRVDGRLPKQVRVATFSGSWAINVSKVVTFKHAPTATVNAINLSWPITLTAYSNEDCIVGREGTNWWLVVPKLEARTAVFATQTASTTIMRSITISATLNTNNCAITVSQTANTSSITVISQTATGSYLRIRVP